MVNDNEMNNEKAQVFLEKQIPVHIVVRDKDWANGFIKEIGSNFLILDEFKKGRLVIFFFEIITMDTFTKEVKE